MEFVPLFMRSLNHLWLSDGDDHVASLVCRLCSVHSPHVTKLLLTRILGSFQFCLFCLTDLNLLHRFS